MDSARRRSASILGRKRRELLGPHLNIVLEFDDSRAADGRTAYRQAQRVARQSPALKACSSLPLPKFFIP